MFLGHLVYLRAKAGGENSMPEKREPLGDAESAVPQDPRDRAKAGLPEPQSPAVQTAHSLLQHLRRSVPWGQTVRFCGLPPPTGGAMGNEPIKALLSLDKRSVKPRLITYPPCLELAS